MGIVRRLVRLAILGTTVCCLTIAAVLYCGTAMLKNHGNGRGLEAGAGAALVLGSGLRRNGSLHSATFRRVQLGVALVQSGQVDYLIMSEGPQHHIPAVGADRMRKAAIDLGASPDRVLMERRATSTFENLRFGAEILAELDMGPPILVTDALHMTRARALAAYVGLDIAGVATVDGIAGEDLNENIRVVVREAMAWWHNLGRALLWEGLGALGYSEDERDGMLIWLPGNAPTAY